jgi:hypothetical protein
MVCPCQNADAQGRSGGPWNGPSYNPFGLLTAPFRIPFRLELREAWRGFRSDTVWHRRAVESGATGTASALSSPRLAVKAFCRRTSLSWPSFPPCSHLGPPSVPARAKPVAHRESKLLFARTVSLRAGRPERLNIETTPVPRSAGASGQIDLRRESFPGLLDVAEVRNRRRSRRSKQGLVAVAILTYSENSLWCSRSGGSHQSGPGWRVPTGTSMNRQGTKTISCDSSPVL